jgi:two-component system NtrC family sensor kinase
VAARELREAAQADRAGVWLITEENTRVLDGVVVESGRRPAHSEWERLDRAMPFLEMLLASVEPVVVDLKKVPQATALGPLVGVRTAAWIPLRAGGNALGLALVAYSVSRMRVVPEVLGEMADELALVVSERRAQEALLRTRAELRSVLDSADAGLLFVDLSGRIRWANARFAELLGLEARPEDALLTGVATIGDLAALLGDRLEWSEASSERYSGRSFTEAWADLHRRSDTPGRTIHTAELELLHPARRLLEHEIRAVRDAEGRACGWLETFRDLGQQRQTQGRRAQGERLAVLGQTISEIAHELNNPLTGIMGYAQLLLGRTGGAERLRDLGRVYQEAERARRIVNNLLMFARGARPERRAADLNELVERVLVLRRYELKVENILLELDLAPGLPRVFLDTHQMEQVLLNLVVNAEQAIRRGRQEGAPTRGRLRIRTRMGSAGRAAVEISDDGPGVPPGAESRIFEPFFTTKPLGQGTGLGLSIAQDIVGEHGGAIRLERERPADFPAGATFAIELPVTVSEAAAEEREGMERPAPRLVPPPDASRAQTIARNGARVLVVEDEPTVAQLLADVLAEEGFRVEAVLNSREGFERALAASFDLVICDLKMPGLDGRGFYEALVRAGVPVEGRILFVTGDTLAARTLAFLEKYNLPYLAKPFLVEDLKAIVHRLLKPASAAQPALRAGTEVAVGSRTGAAGPERHRGEIVRKK